MSFIVKGKTARERNAKPASAVSRCVIDLMYNVSRCGKICRRASRSIPDNLARWFRLGLPSELPFSLVCVPLGLARQLVRLALGLSSNRLGGTLRLAAKLGGRARVLVAHDVLGSMLHLLGNGG